MFSPFNCHLFDFLFSWESSNECIHYITGSGGWPDRTGEDEPVFTYTVSLTDGVTTLVVPTSDMKVLINKATSSSTVLDFGKEHNQKKKTLFN